MGSERQILRLAMNWFNRIFSGFTSRKAPSAINPLVKLLKMVDNTREIEYSCDEVYALIDQYAELVKNGEDAEDLMPLIKQHLLNGLQHLPRLLSVRPRTNTQVVIRFRDA